MGQFVCTWCMRESAAYRANTGRKETRILLTLAPIPVPVLHSSLFIFGRWLAPCTAPLILIIGPPTQTRSDQHALQIQQPLIPSPLLELKLSAGGGGHACKARHVVPRTQSKDGGKEGKGMEGDVYGRGKGIGAEEGRKNGRGWFIPDSLRLYLETRERQRETER